MSQNSPVADPAVFAQTAPDNAYVLGHSLAERQRLDEQGANLRPLTQRLLQDMGLLPGMRVLDVGCGTGDVSLLAAELVGPSGAVVGVDRSTEALAAARLRARTDANVEFVEGDIASLCPAEPFDAVIGRLVLIHQVAPSTVVRHLAGLVRPGGIIGFAEPVMLPQLTWPARPLYTRCITWCITALEAAGLTADTGLHLYSIFQEAGLPDPQLRFEGAIAAGPDLQHARWLAETVRTLLPLMERVGITTSAEADPDSLTERLVAEAVQRPGTACGFALVGAWARIG
jgi:ubiquinone/menaquinone biosynthesis C-methylase UbiE